MIITDKAQIKVAELRESNNLRLSESDELECYELIESDLKLPVDATFARSSVAYLTDGTQVPANTPRFEQGRFGKAIMVEEGTTNLLQNPSFETGDLSNWSTGFGLGITGNASIVTSLVFHGNYAVKIEITSSTSTSDASVKQTINFAAGTTITVLAYLLDIQGDVQAELTIRLSNGQGGYQFLRENFTNPGRCVFTVTVPTGYTADQVWLTIRPRSVGGIGYGIFDAIQLEQKPYATSFINGARSPESLTIPTEGVLNPQEGTVEISIMKPKYLNYNARVLWVEKGSSRFGIHDFPSGGLAWAYSSTDTQLNAGQLLEGQWYYLAMSWNRDEGWAKCYFDGNHIRTIIFEPGTNPGFVGSELLGIGYHPANADRHFNGFFDDLRISNRARTDEEILAAYQSGQPLPVDEWTTYKLDFDDKVRITTQGQIICNELIEI